MRGRPAHANLRRRATRGRWAASAAIAGVAAVAGAAPAQAAPSPFVPEARSAVETEPPAWTDPYVLPPEPEPQPEPPKPAERQRLSNEWTLSRWAYVVHRTRAHRSPSRRSPAVKRLTRWTGDLTPELVLALEQRRLVDGSVWVRVRLPMRPNNRTGWVPRRRLGRFHTVTTALHIDRRRTLAVLYRGGRRVWSSRIGIGQPQWPTPRGRFYVRNRLIPRNKNGIYGIFAFGTSAHSDVLTDWPGGGVVGVHGTNQPSLIPGRISHGCIRVPNWRIAKLRRLMPVGTPIRIR